MVLAVTVGGFLIIVLLTAISGFGSSSEPAVFSVPRHRIDSLVADEVPGAAALAKPRETPPLSGDCTRQQQRCHHRGSERCDSCARAVHEPQQGSNWRDAV